jgi:hypothetical protein
VSYVSLQTSLLDHLIGSAQQRRWDRQAEGFGGPEVDDQFELGWLLDWARVKLPSEPIRYDATGGAA